MVTHLLESGTQILVLNGDSDYIDTNEMDDSRTFNKANELLTRDVDSDSTETSQIQSSIDTGTYDVRGDVDLDGDVDSTDKTTVQNSTATKGGRTNLSHAEHANRKGYAGHEFDDAITHESYYMRHRVLNSVLGNSLTRGANSDLFGILVIGEFIPSFYTMDTQSNASPNVSCEWQLDEALPPTAPDLLEADCAYGRDCQGLGGSPLTVKCCRNDLNCIKPFTRELENCGYYDPSTNTICIFVSGSGEICTDDDDGIQGTLAHELAHAWQECKESPLMLGYLNWEEECICKELGVHTWNGGLPCDLLDWWSSILCGGCSDHRCTNLCNRMGYAGACSNGDVESCIDTCKDIYDECVDFAPQCP